VSEGKEGRGGEGRGSEGKDKEEESSREEESRGEGKVPSKRGKRITTELMQHMINNNNNMFDNTMSQ
jgi:hypothetical protein